MAQTIFKLHSSVKKYHFGKFSDRDWMALHGYCGPQKIHHRISKILLELGADEFLAMMEGKIRVTSFFKGSIW